MLSAATCSGCGKKRVAGTVIGPYVSIDLDKIEHNARIIVALCAAHGIEVSGVSKCTCGQPDVAQAMLRGGVASIADSRLENIARLKSAGVGSAGMLLRLPPLSAVDAVVEMVEVSLNSELAVLTALSAAAERRGVIHAVILMVDLGDLREGVWPDDLIPLVREAVRLPGIRIRGLGTNLACFAGVGPSAANMNQLVALATATEQVLGAPLRWISGANSSALQLIASGQMPPPVNHARIGEAILLGRETIRRRPWPGTFQDAFVLHAEVLEVKIKPSLPLGERGQDAFGRRRTFADRGKVKRALLNVGREDVDVEGIVPLDTGAEILGASSDYLIMDVSATGREIAVGDTMSFSLNYGALLAAMTSEYVQTRLARGGIAAGAQT